MTPSELADLVKRLASDEKAYSKFFAFKEKPIPSHFVKVASMSYTHPSALCRLCEFYLENKKKNGIKK